jgi:hypothetical protein
LAVGQIAGDSLRHMVTTAGDYVPRMA